MVYFFLLFHLGHTVHHGLLVSPLALMSASALDLADRQLEHLIPEHAHVLATVGIDRHSLIHTVDDPLHILVAVIKAVQNRFALSRLGNTGMLQQLVQRTSESPRSRKSPLPGYHPSSAGTSWP